MCIKDGNKRHKVLSVFPSLTSITPSIHSTEPQKNFINDYSIPVTIPFCNYLMCDFPLYAMININE